MICQKCNNEAVLNNVLGKNFYYCRTCKDEVSLTVVDPRSYFDSPVLCKSDILSPGYYVVNFSPTTGRIITKEYPAAPKFIVNWVELREESWLEGTCMQDLRVIPVGSAPTAPKQQGLAGNSFVGGVAGTSPTQQPGQAGNSLGGTFKYSIYPVEQYGVGIIDAFTKLFNENE